MSETSTPRAGQAGDTSPNPGPGSEQSERELARRRIRARRDFSAHLVSYGVVNAFLVGIWAATGAGYFWPGWVLGGWGAGLVLHAWDTFLRRPVTEADVDAEVQRLGRRR
jgi:2TM domain